MSGLQAFTSEPWVALLGWTLLHFLWQGTAIAVLYALVRFVLARYLTANARYMLACAALLGMALAPPLTFLSISGGSTSARVAAWALAVTEWKLLPPIAVGLWVTGVVWFSLRLFGAVQFTRRLRTTAFRAPDRWQQTLEQIAARMGRPVTKEGRQVRLMGSSMVNVPAVIGYLRPVVLVPAEFLTGLPAEHILALLTHEMAHIRRNDYLAGILQSIAEVALFYHPAVWWISGQIRMERELCCDDLVVASGTDRLTYARALTDLESVRPHRLTPQLAANGGSLMDRIRILIEPTYTGSHYLPGAGTVWAMILLMVVGAGVVPVHGAAKTSAPGSPRSASAFEPGFPAGAIPELPRRAFDSLVAEAQKTLLYDPVFSAQLAEPQSMPQSPISVASTSPTAGLVIEPVTVRTGNGAVDGLRAEDFAVTENESPRQISFFEFENVDKLSDAPRTLLAPVTALPRLPRADITAGGQNRYKDHRLLAFYFDTASMPAADQSRALEAAQKFVSGQMSQADMVCLIQYAGAGAEILQDFTGDRNRLLSVIATMARAAGGAGDTGLSPAEPASGYTFADADRKLTALQAVMKTLGSFAEKKSLVYFSDGLNLSPADNQARLRLTINDAVRAGVSIWPVDARSMPASQPTIPGHDALASLGTDTGGLGSSVGDPSAAILSARDSIVSYYIVGYSPASELPDGKFRRVRIALNNTSDAKLDYRQGYFARKNFAAGSDAEHQPERQLEDAMMIGDPITDLTLAAEVNYFRQNNAEYFAPVTVKIPGNELFSTKNNGSERTTLDLAVEITDERGTTVSRMRDHMQIELPDPADPESAKRPATYNTGATVLPGTYSIKIVARDSDTGRMGMYLGRFTVQNLNKEAQLPISSVVLSSQFVDDAAPAVHAGGKAPAVNPLVLDGKRMIPSVTRVFSSRGDLNVYLQAFEKNAKTATPLTASIAFYKGSVKVMEAPPVTVSDGLDSKSGMLPIRMNVGLGGLKPGAYDCQVTVLDPATQKTSLWQKPVMIVP